jgi:hypothetical protein
VEALVSSYWSHPTRDAAIRVWHGHHATSAKAGLVETSGVSTQFMICVPCPKKLNSGKTNSTKNTSHLADWGK